MGQEIDKEKMLELEQRQIKELSPKEREMLFAMMEGFQNAAQETIKGGEELLKMCDGCAFKKGTEANKYSFTVLTAIECVLTSQPFYCHKRFCQNGEEKLCNGWINIMNNK